MRIAFVALIFCWLGPVALAEPPRPVYRQAVAAFDAKDWNTAAEQFKNAYHRDPTAPEAEDSLFFWAESLLQAGRLDDAKNRFDDYLRQWPRGRRVRAAHFRLAETLVLGRRYQEAKYRIQRFIALYPSDPLLEYTTAYQAEIAMAEDRLLDADRFFNEVIQKYPQSPLVPESQLGLARVCSKRGQLERAIELLKPLVRHRDVDNRIYREAVILRGSLYARLGQAAPALPDESAPTQPSPNKPDATASNSLPSTSSPASPTSQAGTATGTTIDQPDQNAETMWRKARSFEQAGKFDPALVAYEDIFRKRPRSPQADDARLAAARIYTQLQQHRQAKSLYDELLVRSDKKETSLDRVAILFEAAQVEEQLEGNRGPKMASRSIELLERLLAEFPNSPYSARTAYRLARHEADIDHFDAARKYLEKSIDSGDPLLMAHSLQLTWRMAAAQNDWATVRRTAERFLTLDDKQFPAQLDSMARFWIAEADYRMGQFPSARHRFDALLKRIDDRTCPWAGLVALRSAQSLAQLGDFTSARRAAEKGAAQFPTFADRHEFDYLIGRCALAQGDHLTARTAFDRVARSPAAQKTGLALLAREGIASTFFAQQDYESAIAEFTKLQTDDVPAPHRAKALHYTALCHDRLGRKQHAETLYQRLVDRYPDYKLR